VMGVRQTKHFVKHPKTVRIGGNLQKRDREAVTFPQNPSTKMPTVVKVRSAESLEGDV